MSFLSTPLDMLRHFSLWLPLVACVWAENPWTRRGITLSNATVNISFLASGFSSLMMLLDQEIVSQCIWLLEEL